MKKSSIVHFSLNNGMKVLIKEIHHFPLVLLLPWVNVGSNNESDDIAGISHFIEHLLFKGTRKRGKGQLAEEIESLGGYFDAFTSNCFTAYYVLVPSQHFHKALRIQFDQLTNPSFPRDEIEREWNVVLEEIRIYNDIPEIQMIENLNRTAFQKHRNGRSVIGYKKVIENIDRNRILSYYSNYYKPNNASLIICGDIRADKIRSQIEKVYGTWQKGNIEFDYSPAEPVQKAFRSTFKNMEIKENFVGLGFKVPKFMHPDSSGLEVLRYLLVECGESAVLVKSLKNEKRLLTSISSLLSSNTAPGLFNIFGIQNMKKSPNDAAAATLQEIQLLIEKGFTSLELEKAKNHVFRKFISEIESVSWYGVQLGKYNCFGDYHLIEEYADRIKKVTPEDIKRLLNKYFTLKNLTISELLPKESKGSTLIKKDIEKSLFRVQKGAKPEVEKIVVKECKGYKLILEERHYIPKVATIILFKSGSAYENKNNNGISRVMLESLFGGTKSRSAEEIAFQLDKSGTIISKECKKEYCYLKAEMLSDYFDSSMDVILDCLVNPVFPKKEVEKQKENVITNLHTKEDMPIFFCRSFFESVYFADHPYGLCEFGNEKAIKRIMCSDVMKWHKKFITGGNIIISTVGDITSEEVISVADKFLSKLKKRSLPKIPPFRYKKRGLWGERSKEREQSHLVIGGKIPGYGKSKIEFDIIKQILGTMSGRLFKHLRDEESLAYAVFPIQKRFVQTGVFGVYIGTKPEQEKIAREGIIRELKNLKKGFATTKEIAKAKKICISKHLSKIQNFGNFALECAEGVRYGQSPLKVSDYPAEIEKVSKEKLEKLVKKYIRPKETTVAIIHGEKEK